ncbi:adapter molecule Crk [Patella vulgata]|uniref:adapter molecule Crk n=1 Tax=Patella vulgata TaxID=6465 RepID=UPI00217F530D|nr:adapter molecule Crk [Patella vulgata]
MASDFDAENKYSWYFGPLTREEANEILMAPTLESGIFLIRDSKSIRGDCVLCVREDTKVSHYIINKIQMGPPGSLPRFRIGDQEFSDIPSLLTFYKTHYLDTTSLIKPAPREKIRAKYDFPGKDLEDLPFLRGDVLEVISKDEEKWWTCRNKHGQVGQIPVPYVEKYEINNHPTEELGMVYRTPTTVSDSVMSSTTNIGNRHSALNNVKLPAKACVIQDRIPNAYDKTQLKLLKGEIITVTKMNVNGQWEGVLNDKTGIFPFTHVKFVDDQNGS